MNEKKQALSALQRAFSEHGRIPPQAVELEEAVLGAVMLITSAITKIENLIRPETFYKESHQRIFKACKDLRNKGEEIDILTVTNQLKSSGELELVGGAYHITQLTDRVSSAANIEYHARIIHQKYVQREIIRMSSELQRDAFEDTTDVIELVDRFQLSSAAIGELLLTGRLNIQHISDVVPGALSDLGESIARTRDNKLAGIPTPFNKLNKVTGGWRNTDLIILAGRPGMGKTALALAFAMTASLGGKNVSIFSLEMSSVRLVARLLIAGSGVDPTKYKNGWLSNDEQDKVIEYSDKLLGENIWIDDSPYASVEHIKSTARIQKDKGELDLIIIDYLQLAKPAETYNGSREAEIAEVSRNLKGLAKELDVPVILLAQLNRMVEARGDKRPVLSDLRESGAIEQDADMVLFAYRPEYYKITEDEQGNDLRGVGFILIAKNREGALEDIPFKHSRGMTEFFDYEQKEDLPF